MKQRKFETGTPVFFYTMIDRISGVIHNASYDAGEWIYEVMVDGGYIVKNVKEHMLSIRTIINPPKYKRGDMVRFKYSGDADKLLTGVVEIVDRYGTFEQDEEPSYDIYVKEDEGESGCIYKHIRESLMIETI